MFRTLVLFMRAFARTFWRRRRFGPLRPSWSFEFESVVRYLRMDWEATADWDFARLRSDMQKRPYPKAAARKVTLREGSVGGAHFVRFAPPRPRRRGLILFFHGGSYIFGSARTTHAELLASVALSSGTEVVALEYRLAPEHRFPAQHEDALRAFDVLLDAGTPPLEDPRISPTFARLEGLAPVLVVVGECEIPRDDILVLAKKLEAASVDVTLHVAPEMPHNAAVFAAYHPSGKRALEAVASFVERLLPPVDR